MLKGHIDRVEDGFIEGWVYSALAPLTGQRILAFDGSECIGAGTVEVHRPDLEAAGLGDGRLGFQLKCDAQVLQGARQPHLRLQDSDWQLPLKPARAEPVASALRHLAPFGAAEAARLAWMSAQGLFSQAEYALARALNSTGTYVCAFSRKEIPNISVSQQVSGLLSRTLSTMFRSNIPASAFTRAQLSDVQALHECVAGLPFEQQFVAIVESTARCELVEGRHAQPESSAAGETPVLLTQELSSYQALICHASCMAGISSAAPVTVLHIAAPPIQPAN